MLIGPGDRGRPEITELSVCPARRGGSRAKQQELKGKAQQQKAGEVHRGVDVEGAEAALVVGAAVLAQISSPVQNGRSSSRP